MGRSVFLGAHSFVISKISKLLSSRNNSVKAAFDEFDGNASGELDHHEMRLALLDLGYDLDDYQFFDFMRQVDVNSDGKVSLDEFQVACEKLHINLFRPFSFARVATSTISIKAKATSLDVSGFGVNRLSKDISDSIECLGIRSRVRP